MKGKTGMRTQFLPPLLKIPVAVGGIFLFGTIGYSILGDPKYTLLDSMYMTAITLTTVGYGEAIDLTHNPPAKIFTIILLISGIGIVGYAFSSGTAFLVKGNFEQLMWRRRMIKAIANLSNHFIVCGAGNTGQHIIKELLATQRPFVAVDTSRERLNHLSDLFGQEFPVVIGDGTEDEILLAAGVERASGIAACLSNDKDNFIVTVSSRILRPNLRIVCRCFEERVVTKIRKAGANSVVSPNQIGGLRIVSELIRPTVVSFLDTMLHEKNEGLRIEEAKIAENSKLLGQTIGDIQQREIGNLLVVALLCSNGQWQYNPKSNTELQLGMRIVFMGNPKSRNEFEELCAAG